MENSRGGPYCAIINKYIKSRTHHCTKKRENCPATNLKRLLKILCESFCLDYPKL
jgi:hypothetical protein